MSVVITADKSAQGNDWIGKKPAKAKKADTKDETSKEKK